MIITTANPERAIPLMEMADALLTKPVRLADLRTEINRLLALS